jgi:3-methylfumaryl-CoA hydratase
MTKATQAAQDVDISEQRLALGRTWHDEDLATLAPMHGLGVTFDRPEPRMEWGQEVPPGWHHAYFVPNAPLKSLGKDGMPVDNGVLPPMPFPRRMHAGNRLTFHAPLRVGDKMHRECVFSDIQVRQGRTGPLIFTLQTRRIYNEHGLAVTEENRSAFRAPVEAGSKGESPGMPAPPKASWERPLKADPVSLFRYSALTFNPHRIHYDRKYAMDVEGYPGLVVHGMFTGQSLLDLARDHLPGKRFTNFEFRAIAPIFDTAPCMLLGEPDIARRHINLWALTPLGAVAMKVDIDYE